MKEPLDHETARKHIEAILEGPGMTVFTKRLKDDLMENAMTSLDAVNVLRGGKITTVAQAPDGWRYRAHTRRMTVEFSFRGHDDDPTATPGELVLERAWRNDQ